MFFLKFVYTEYNPIEKITRDLRITYLNWFDVLQKYDFPDHWVF
jgi:hypothetical protein